MKIVYFAVATTGLDQDANSICELAAMGEHDESPRSINVLPSGKFTSQASSYNGYTLRISNDGERHLLRNGIEVETSPLQKGLEDFIHFLLEKAEGSCTTVLLGWNSQTFHIKLLLQAFKQCGISIKPLESAGICYGDPLLMIRARRENFQQLSGVHNLKLPDIYNHLHRCNDSEPNCKNACHIISMLKTVVSSLDVSEKYLKEAHCIYTLTSAKKVLSYDLRVKRNLASLEGRLYCPTAGSSRVVKGVINKSTAKKIAQSGLKYKDLKKVHHRCGREGLEGLLKAPLDGAKPRVTKDQRVIDKIVSHFEQRKSRHT